MFTLEWAAEDCLALIEQYQKRPILWDKTAIGHKNRQRKALAWMEIAQKIGCSKQEVERKLNVLLTQYRRERQKIMVRFHECPEDPYSPSWYAFKAFAFLEDVRQPSKINNKVRPSLRNGSSSSIMTQINGNHSSLQLYLNKPEREYSDPQKISSQVTPENRPLPKLDVHTSQNGVGHYERQTEPSPLTTKVFLPTMQSRTNEAGNKHTIRSNKTVEKRKLSCKPGKERKELRNTLQKLMKRVMNEDEYDFIGNNTTSKLRLMERSQRIIAEKLIGDILFYGQVNKLTNSAEVIPTKDKIGDND